MSNYSIDTSSILDAWVRYYPLDTFPSFWTNFSLFAKNKIGIATELIKHEISNKDDGCIKWFKENKLDDFFVPIDNNIQSYVTELMKNPNYQRLVEDRKGTNGADPFVIALAQSQNLIVVTGEKATNNLSKPKIPDVCKDIGINCITILELMRKEGWKF
ncbi:MAG: DUF4411 family protein [Bacteroidales bacterium]|nr:DUF4411 family protein [Bacteroidales bacterium]